MKMAFRKYYIVRAQLRELVGKKMARHSMSKFHWLKKMNQNKIIIILFSALMSCTLFAQNKISDDKLFTQEKEENNSSWFSKSLEFKGIAVQDDDWQIWGCSPIIGPEGKTHLFVARWPVETGHQGWYTDSQVAHYVGETPEGPFKFSDIVLEATGKDTWDILRMILWTGTVSYSSRSTTTSPSE